jgi:DDE family transposase
MALAHLPDPRARRGVRHQLPVVVSAAVCAVVAGYRSYTAIAEWVGDVPAATVLALGIDPDRRPSEAMIRRLLQALDPDLLTAAIGAWLTARAATGQPDARTAIAVDGKTLRGSRTADTTARHVLAACDQDTSVVLASTDVDGKTNEITRFQPLLDQIGDIRDTVITVDALHCQRDHVTYLAERGADWILTVKGNQCATRRSDTFPFQAGQTRREVCWVRWLTWIRKVKETRACQETGGRVQMPETACRETRAVWRRLDCLNPNLQRQQFTATGKASETGVRRGRGVLVHPGQPSRRKRYPTRAFKEMSGAPAAALFRVSETNVGSPSQSGWRCRSARSSRRSNVRPGRTGKPFTGRRSAGDADYEKRWRYA